MAMVWLMALPRIIPAQPVANLALASESFSLAGSGRLLVFTVVEADQGIDLNGDSDSLDGVVHVHDRVTGTTWNTGLAGSSPRTDGRWVVFRVFEFSQGNTDLNGDGDSVDNVIHVFDPATGTANNLLLANSFGSFGRPGVVQGAVAFASSEASQGNTDLNGDGDTTDDVYFLHNPKSMTTFNLGLASCGDAGPALNSRFAVMEVDEANQGNRDLNRDGDTSDCVLFAHNIRGNVTRNLRLAGIVGGASTIDGPRELEGRLAALIVDEAAQGGMDLNLDGDASDHVVHVLDARARTLTNLELAGNGTQVQDFSSSDRLVAFSVSESAQGNTNLNGDHELDDEIFHVYDAQLGVTTNTMVETEGIKGGARIVGRHVFFSAFEDVSDLNMDGDINDPRVLQVFDAATTTTTNLEIAIEGIVSMPAAIVTGPNGGRYIAVLLDEGDQEADANADGDQLDSVLYVVDRQTLTVTNVGLATAGSGDTPNAVQVFGNIVSFDGSEADQGSNDANLDGDSTDHVLGLYNARTGTLVNTGLAVSGSVLIEGGLGAVVPESDQGNMDLNGDRDTDDEVVHVIG